MIVVSLPPVVAVAVAVAVAGVVGAVMVI